MLRMEIALFLVLAFMEALSQIDNLQPDIVIMDINIPMEKPKNCCFPPHFP